MSCSHPEFAAEVEVTRILNGVEEDEGGELVAFAVDARVRCVECGEAFAWRGVPCGVSVNGGPTRNVDGTELRAWLISPAEQALLDGPPGLVGP